MQLSGTAIPHSPDSAGMCVEGREGDRLLHVQSPGDFWVQPALGIPGELLRPGRVVAPVGSDAPQLGAPSQFLPF